MQNDLTPMLAIMAGTSIWCRSCRASVPMRNKDKRYLVCGKGHRTYGVTVALALSTDDEESPTRLLAPAHCLPAYAIEAMETERWAMGRMLLEVPQ